ncbi:unnamed protein product [Rhizophagus irregularis]|nr:unnamed protein product [Rhizophagus irregularis]
MKFKYIEKCKDINVETETSQPQGTKRKRQQIFDEYKFAFTFKDQIILESLLIRAFCSAGISFNIIENEDFILFLKKACSSFKIPSRFTLSNTLLDQKFEHLELVVNSALSESPTYCLISDGWPNIQRTSIVNYMILTPKPLFFKATAFKEERHIAENIALGLETTMKDAGINKFGAIITDNALNMKTAWKILKQKYPKKIFLGCWVHGIHLWMKDIITIRSTIAEDHLNLDDRMKSLISSDTFWNDLGKIRNFLENFAIFIKKLGDKTFLSTAYFEYQQLKWQNFLYNPVVIVAYKLDLRYRDSWLNVRIFDPIIEKEILSLVREEYKNIVLTELAEYVGKTGSFAHSYL